MIILIKKEIKSEEFNQIKDDKNVIIENKDLKETDKNRGETEKSEIKEVKNENLFPQNQFINFSQAGRNYQRGYSHGYNILTGEIFQFFREFIFNIM